MKRITVVGMDPVRKMLALGGQVAVNVLVEVLRNESLLAFRDSQRMTPHATGVLRAPAW